MSDFKPKQFSIDGISGPRKQAMHLHAQPRVAVRPTMVKTFNDITPAQPARPIQLGNLTGIDAPVKVVVKPMAVKQYSDMKQVSRPQTSARPAHMRQYESHISNFAASGRVAAPETALQKPVEPIKPTDYIVEEKEPVKIERKKSKFAARFALSFAILTLLVGLGVFVTTTYANKKGITEVANAAASKSNGRPSVSAEENPVSDEELSTYEVAPDEPRILTIEKLGINARVTQVSMNEVGSIETPGNIFDSGWFNGSKKPGTSGAALIIGHYSGSTKDGVFSEIHNLEVDDEISVERGDGQILTYKVVDKRHYSASELDLAAALSPITPGTQGLNLISCGSSFDDASIVYKERVVVFTERVDTATEAEPTVN